MDMSGLSNAEQAQMVQIIEKKQVRSYPLAGRASPDSLIDARLHEPVLRPCRALLHVMLQ
jgi:hypothetical protein